MQYFVCGEFVAEKVDVVGRAAVEGNEQVEGQGESLSEKNWSPIDVPASISSVRRLAIKSR